MVLNQSIIRKTLLVFGVLSLFVSVGAIVIWARNCYDVFLLSDARQNIRMFILRQVDRDLERALDQHFPGPRGNRGYINVVEPDDFLPPFQKPMVFMSVGAGTILGQAIQFLLAIWLLIVVKSDSHPGVRVWLIGTLLIVIGTAAGLIVLVVMTTFHGNAVATSAFIIGFYAIGLMVAFKYRPGITVNLEMPKSPDVKLKKSTDWDSVKNSTVYKPVVESKAAVSSCCGDVVSCLL